MNIPFDTYGFTQDCGRCAQHAVDKWKEAGGTYEEAKKILLLTNVSGHRQRTCIISLDFLWPKPENFEKNMEYFKENSA